ncbi:hypothetical protein NQK81_12850 [Amycolatopsis roodepoortensis]|nr:hypothetical protein [Amycolatopsis roodepoortensis]UUV34293.1 hypothetical protein NQK81_12850 [Amycolatopsis roodepoortensis]
MPEQRKRKKRRTRGNGPGRRTVEQLHLHYIKLLITVIPLVSLIVEHFSE